MMPRRNGRRKNRRRVRGSDGKLYDPQKQRDNGYQAHENRLQTHARRTWWRLRGFGSAVWSLLWMLLLPLRYAWGGLQAGWAYLTDGRSRPRRGGRSR